MVSGHDWTETRRVALDAGAAAFLGKPFPAESLLTLLDAILGPPPAPSPRPMGPAPPAPPGRHIAG
jgi:DNA-binding response OmpR family regulator